MSKYISKEKALELSKKDYLTPAEITKRIVSQVRPDLLYRTHVSIHSIAKADNSPKIIKAHKLVADELKSRGIFHHQWDKLDTDYKY